ncbi:MAG TPA: DUF4403 family protein [Thermoanaerobaculia bacterium]
MKRIITRAISPLLLAAVASAQTPVPPPAAPPPELSTFVVPIRTSLAQLSPQLEAQVPKTFRDTVAERGIDVTYQVARDPIALQMIGAGLHARTVMHYSIEACRGRFPCVSCGVGETMRQADITLHTKLDWDPAWRLRSKTTPLPVHYAKPCQVTWLGLDVTPRFIAPQVSQQLAIAARTIDANTPALTNIKPYAQQIWNSLQTPFELAPRTWLVLEPSEVSLGPITGAGTNVTSTLSMRAVTRVVVGEKPAPPRKPLPALRLAPPPAGGMRVPLDVELSYADATRLASAEVAGKKLDISGRPLTIESIRILPAANGRLALEAMIDYRGGVLRNYHGLVFLEGTPRFDPPTASVVVPDLDYSLDPKRRGFLVRIAERAAHDAIRARLRQSARFPLGPRITALRAEITRALTRTLAPGVTLRGRADAIEPKSVTALPNAILVHVVATGAAEVSLAMR